MCLIFSFIPATIWLVIGYFVLFSTKKTEGNLSKFGFILAIWIFIVAALFPICGAYMTFSDKCPIVKMMQINEMPLEY